MNKKMTLEEFIAEVDVLSKKKFGLVYTDEQGKECERMIGAFEDGDTPDEFVTWWGDKYGLDELIRY